MADGSETGAAPNSNGAQTLEGQVADPLSDEATELSEPEVLLSDVAEEDPDALAAVQPTKKGGAKKAAGKPAAAKKSAAKKSAAKKSVAKKSAAKKSAPATATRQQRSFPAAPFEDAMELANVMQKLGTERARRLTIFEALGRSADSGSSRQLVINSGRYNLTTGGYQAEWIELTEDGRIATSPDVTDRQRLRARFKLAIESVPPFRELYDECVNKRFPSHAVLRDFLRDKGYNEGELQECVDTFTINARFLGLLRSIAGAERLLSIEHVLDNLLAGSPSPLPGAEATVPASPPTGVHDWSTTCFYVSPIGDEDSEERKHSDLFLGALVEPAVAEFGLTVVRADQIGKPGMITAQVIEHIVNARLVIADLSFHNPNVFYEVALRHARRKPLVQLIRVADRIPFDLDQVRTIRVDTTDIYSLVPQIESYRSEISSQVRRALEGTAPVESPLTVFFPTFWDDDNSRGSNGG